MTPEHFDWAVERRIRKIRAVLSNKGKEYASETDRMHNFKVAARFDGSTPERALWGMLLKHLVSVKDQVDALDRLPVDHMPDLPRWQEKLGDAINYLVLLEGLIWERVDREFDHHIQNQPAVEVNNA